MTEGPSPADFTILYVEDETTSREQVKRMLNTRGYRMVVAENGRDGLELYLSHKPDIVITDILMPIASGLEMAREIRAREPDAQIIVMTAFNDTDYLLQAIDIGINQFVLKPVALQKLFEAVERSINVVTMQRRQRRLEEENLRSRKMEAIGILAGGMAHDFNNLLQVILGYISLAKLHVSSPKTIAEMLEIAEQSSLHARELSMRLLAFARGGETCAHPVSPAPLIMSVVATALSGRPALASEFRIAPDLRRVRMDYAQMERTFSNLAQNAVEAMPYGGTLRLEGENVTIGEQDALSLPVGEYVHIAFHDTGKGIAPETLPRIFDPYFTTKELGNQKGMGLSLALCHSIISKHKGLIHAESTPGRGATFHIYLPALVEEPGIPHAPAAALGA